MPDHDPKPPRPPPARDPDPNPVRDPDPDTVRDPVRAPVRDPVEPLRAPPVEPVRARGSGSGALMSGVLVAGVIVAGLFSYTSGVAPGERTEQARQPIETPAPTLPTQRQ